MKQMTFLDLCSGIGGFRLGLETAGHKCIGYCEYDKFARASYEAMYDTEGEWKAHDVTKLKPEDVPYADIWCFGFPCQDISVAGKQRGLVGKRSGIYYNIIDLLKGKEELADNDQLAVSGGADEAAGIPVEETVKSPLEPDSTASENAGEAKLVIEYTRSDLEERLEAVRTEAEKYQDDQTMSQTSRYATAEYVRNLWDRELNLIYSSIHKEMDESAAEALRRQSNQI